MPKPAFIEKKDGDDNDIDFKLASCVYILSTGNNQTQRSVMGHNIAGPLGEQGLSKATLL